MKTADLLALSNCVNEVLNNSSVDAHDCVLRIGISIEKLKSVHSSLKSILNENNTGYERCDVWKNGDSIQLISITAYGDPVDMGIDELKSKGLAFLNE